MVDWLWHPSERRPRVLTQAAKRAIIEIFPWLELIEFTPGGTITPFSSPTTAFKQSLSDDLKSLSNSRWTIQTPLLSHITRISSAHVLSQQRRFRRIDRQSITKTTLAFKAIASTQRVCPVDETPDFRAEKREIFNTFADAIRSELSSARSFDVIVHELSHHADGSTNRQTHCVEVLIAALQQAIYVGSKHYRY